MEKLRPYWWMVLCLAAPAIAFVAVRPGVEMGFNDDWQYVRSARLLADTGRFVYDGYTGPMTVPHALWGATVIRIFGFSYFALRLSVLPFWAGCGLLVYLLGGRIGLTREYSALASLCFTLSPIAVPLGASFMTDISAVMLMLLTTYCTMRAIAAARITVAAWWLAAGAVAGLVSGMIREILWAAPLCMIAVAVLWRWRERRLRIAGMMLVALVIAGGIVATAWHYSQPHALRQTVEWPTSLRRELWGDTMASLCMWLTILLMSLPVLVCLVMRVRDLRGRALAVTCVLLAFTASFVLWMPWISKAPWVGNLLTEYGSFNPDGVLLGDRPVVLQPAVRVLLGLTALLGTAVWVGAAVQVAGQYRRRMRAAIAGREPFLVFAAIAGPFVAGYLGFLAHQSNSYPIFDRYLLPMVAIVLLYTAGLASRLKPGRVSAVGWAALAVMAAFAVANTHDLYAANRAKLAAATWLTGQGVSRQCLSAGYEYDGATQLEERGFVSRGSAASLPVQLWFLNSLFGAVTPCYYVASSPQPKLGGTVREIVYRTWLPPRARNLLIQRVAGECPAGCR